MQQQRIQSICSLKPKLNFFVNLQCFETYIKQGLEFVSTKFLTGAEEVIKVLRVTKVPKFMVVF